MALNKTKIEDLRLGKIILKHTGTKSELQEIILAAFPENLPPTGMFVFYGASTKNKNSWRWLDDDEVSQRNVLNTEVFYIEDNTTIIYELW